MKLKKIIINFAALLFVTKMVFAQKEIKLEKEKLADFNLSDKGICFSRDTEDGGPYIRIAGPFINSEGEFAFYYGRVLDNYYSSLVYSAKSLKESFKSYFLPSIPTSFYGQSINGFLLPVLKNYFYVYRNKVFVSIDDYRKVYKDVDEWTRYSYFRFYPVEKGIVLENTKKKETKKKEFIGIEIENQEYKRLVPDSEINEWLKPQKGLYEVRDDHKLYRNGILWSTKNFYNCRLRSGHVITRRFDSDGTYSTFTVYTPDGAEELEFTFTWTDKDRPYSSAFGNYGEFYSLTAPEQTPENNYHVGSGEKAELICIRNYLKYFGVLTDDKVRLRKGPGIETEILGVYPIDTGFRILENSGVKQTIDGVNSEWIKVRLLDGTEGYFFGAFVKDLYEGPGTPLPWPNVPDWD